MTKKQSNYKNFDQIPKEVITNIIGYSSVNERIKHKKSLKQEDVVFSVVACSDNEIYELNIFKTFKSASKKFIELVKLALQEYMDNYGLEDDVDILFEYERRILEAIHNIMSQSDITSIIDIIKKTRNLGVPEVYENLFIYEKLPYGIKISICTTTSTNYIERNYSNIILQSIEILK